MIEIMIITLLVVFAAFILGMYIGMDIMEGKRRKPVKVKEISLQPMINKPVKEKEIELPPMFKKRSAV